MQRRSVVELRDFRLETRIGVYGPGDAVPDAHLLDMTLSIDPGLVLVAADDMAHVFDYDPLLQEIDRLARERRYETQEGLITRIVAACAACPEIDALEIALRKTPAPGRSGSLGIRLAMDAKALSAMR